MGGYECCTSLDNGMNFIFHENRQICLSVVDYSEVEYHQEGVFIDLGPAPNAINMPSSIKLQSRFKPSSTSSLF